MPRAATMRSNARQSLHEVSDLTATPNGDPGFGERYRITTIRGNIYSFEQMRAAALRCIRTSPLPLHGSTLGAVLSKGDESLVDALLADDSFMRFRAGLIPARVAEDIEEAVWLKLRAT